MPTLGRNAEPLENMAVGIMSCRRLSEEPRATALDRLRGRLFVADGYGLFASRSKTLLDADCDLDCRSDGYAAFGAHIRSVRSIQVSLDGKYMASVSDLDNNLIVHELDSYSGRRFAIARVFECGERVQCLAFSSDSRSVMLALHDGKVHVFRLDDGIGERIPPLQHDSRVLVMSTALAGTLHVLSCVCADGTCWVWGLDRSRVLAVIRPARAHDDKSTQQWEGHTVAIQHCSLSEDGMRLVTASGDSACKVWQLALALASNAARAHKMMGIGPAEYLARVQEAEARTGCKAQLTHTLEHAGACNECVFASDALIVTTSTDATCVGWCAISGAKVFQVSCIGGNTPRILAAARDAATSAHHVHLCAYDWIVCVEVCGREAVTRQFGCGGTDEGIPPEQCVWLMAERQRILKHGFRLAEVPSLVAHNMLSPSSLLDLILASLGFPPHHKSAFRAAVQNAELPTPHVLRLLAQCRSLRDCARFAVMLYAHCTTHTAQSSVSYASTTVSYAGRNAPYKSAAPASAYAQCMGITGRHSGTATYAVSEVGRDAYPTSLPLPEGDALKGDVCDKIPKGTVDGGIISAVRHLCRSDAIVSEDVSKPTPSTTNTTTPAEIQRAEDLRRVVRRAKLEDLFGALRTFDRGDALRRLLTGEDARMPSQHSSHSQRSSGGVRGVVPSLRLMQYTLPLKDVDHVLTSARGGTLKARTAHTVGWSGAQTHRAHGDGKAYRSSSHPNRSKLQTGPGGWLSARGVKMYGGTFGGVTEQGYDALRGSGAMVNDMLAQHSHDTSVGSLSSWNKSIVDPRMAVGDVGVTAGEVAGEEETGKEATGGGSASRRAQGGGRVFYAVGEDEYDVHTWREDDGGESVSQHGSVASPLYSITRGEHDVSNGEVSNEHTNGNSSSTQHLDEGSKRGVSHAGGAVGGEAGLSAVSAISIVSKGMHSIVPKVFAVPIVREAPVKSSSFIAYAKRYDDTCAKGDADSSTGPQIFTLDDASLGEDERSQGEGSNRPLEREDSNISSSMEKIFAENVKNGLVWIPKTYPRVESIALPSTKKRLVKPRNIPKSLTSRAQAKGLAGIGDTSRTPASPSRHPPTQNTPSKAQTQKVFTHARPYETFQYTREIPSKRAQENATPADQRKKNDPYLWLDLEGSASGVPPHSQEQGVRQGSVPPRGVSANSDGGDTSRDKSRDPDGEVAEGESVSGGGAEGRGEDASSEFKTFSRVPPNFNMPSWVRAIPVINMFMEPKARNLWEEFMAVHRHVPPPSLSYDPPTLPTFFDPNARRGGTDNGVPRLPGETKQALRRRRHGDNGVPPMECKLMCQPAMLVCEGVTEWEGGGSKADREVLRDGERIKLVITADAVSVPVAVDI